MSALAVDRETPVQGQVIRSRPYKMAAVEIFAGSLVALNAAGYLTPAANTAGLRVVGVAQTTIDNSAGAAGDETMVVDEGVFLFENGSPALTQAHVGSTIFAQDDQTVSSSSTQGIKAGVMLGIDATTSDVIVLVEADGMVAESGIETVSSAGAISPHTFVTLLSVTGTAAYTLADGVFHGQRKRIYCTVAASTPAGTVTPASLDDGTSYLFNAVGEWVELIWNVDGWQTIGIQGATLS